MNVLLTSAGSDLGQLLAEGLSDQVELRLTDREPAELFRPLAVMPLGHDASTALLVKGMDTIVHVAEPLEDEPVPSYIDYVSRCTYNLLMAAHAQGVRRVVYLSTLATMQAHGPEYRVTERWRPRPTPEHPMLGKHLGEYVCREFAREHKLQVVVLRLGNVMDLGPAPASVDDPTRLAQSDLVEAVACALETQGLPMWSVLHIQGEFDGAQFPIDDAKEILRFTPTGSYAS